MQPTKAKAIEDGSISYSYGCQTVNNLYKLWKQLSHDKSIEPVLTLTLAISITANDLMESSLSARLSVTGEGNQEIQFASKAACRTLALRLFEQREKLSNYKFVIRKAAEDQCFAIDFEPYEKIYASSKKDLLYISRLSVTRNEGGHYSTDHKQFINRIDEIEPVRLIKAASSLINCYKELMILLANLTVFAVEKVGRKDVLKMVFDSNTIDL